MTRGPVAPVIPPGTSAARRGRGTAARRATPLPLASSPSGSPALPAGVVYGTGRIDTSGRITDHTITSVLGWHSGDRLTLTAEAGVVIARRDPGGMVTLPARPRIIIPAPLRRRCGLRAGDPVLLAELLPDSPSWYNIASSVTHSIYWGLRDVDGSHPGEPLALTPNVLDVGAAAESAISASGLILDRCGKCYGHDPSAHVQRTKERREAIDALMRRATTSRWAHISTEPQHRGPGGRQR